MQALQKVDDSLLLQSNALLTNITGAFAALTTVRGALAIDGNAALAAVTGASFGSLTGVGQSLDISDNTKLGSITNAFQVSALCSQGGSHGGLHVKTEKDAMIPPPFACIKARFQR